MREAVETASQAVFWKYQRARPVLFRSCASPRPGRHHAGDDAEVAFAGAGGGGPECVVLEE